MITHCEVNSYNVAAFSDIEQETYRYRLFPDWSVGGYPVNQREKIDQSDSFLPSTELAYPRGWTWHSYRQGSAELDISEEPKKYFATERKP